MDELEKYFDRLWPINRSLTGNGNRETLAILKEIIDIEIKEVPSGTQCFDWTIPPEWNIKNAWIKDENGNIIVDFKENNLHVLGYSTPVHAKMTLGELKPHLYSLPSYPEVIPYLTSYYKERWGFCMSDNQLQLLQDGIYEVFIDSGQNPNGSLTYGEAVLKGASDQEVLFSTYICHPSLANNELSGPLVTSYIYKTLKGMGPLKYTYRFLFVPETIGSIMYLSKNGNHLKDKLIAGYTVTCIGDPGNFTFKRSTRGNTVADRAAELVLKQTEKSYTVKDFFPSGSDERQYCSPGFNLPVGSLMRTMYGLYKEYHTSADNKSFISFDAMRGSIEKYVEIVKLIEINDFYINNQPYGEPQLGKRGLYPTLGSQKTHQLFVDALLWFLNYSDGEHDLIEIIDKSGLPYTEYFEVVKKTLDSGLVSRRSQHAEKI